jgi:hypothetical protein
MKICKISHEKIFVPTPHNKSYEKYISGIMINDFQRLGEYNKDFYPNSL